jgi:serine/threonine protein phosphatase PrpC
MWRAISLPSMTAIDGSLRSRRRHAPTALFAVAAIVGFRPVSTSTLMEADQRQRIKKGECPFYGCPLLPQDVYYDAPAKEALGSLRMLKRDQVMDDNSEQEDSFAPLVMSGQKHMATLTLIGYKGGPLESQVNQDRAFCVSPYLLQGEEDAHEERRLLGVFDGHAPLGEKVSEYALTELPKLLASKLKAIQAKEEKDNDSMMIQQALIETFVELDKTAPAEISGGCTASVILQQGPKIYVANAGDSRSFIVVYRSKSQTAQVVFISREDKPNLPDERARVEKAGGVVYVPFRGTSRVLYTDPTTGSQSGLAMSRSIGDWEAGKLGVIPHPIVDVIDIPELIAAQLLTDCDEDGTAIAPECSASDDDVRIFAISATDGMMDYATPEIIAQAVASSLFDKEGTHLITAIEQLIYMAAQGWEQDKQGRYRDDIAMAVTQIRIPPPSPTQ